MPLFAEASHKGRDERWRRGVDDGACHDLDHVLGIELLLKALLLDGHGVEARGGRAVDLSGVECQRPSFQRAVREHNDETAVGDRGEGNGGGRGQAGWRGKRDQGTGTHISAQERDPDVLFERYPLALLDEPVALRLVVTGGESAARGGGSGGGMSATTLWMLKER